MFVFFQSWTFLNLLLSHQNEMSVICPVTFLSTKLIFWERKSSPQWLALLLK